MNECNGLIQWLSTVFSNDSKSCPKYTMTTHVHRNFIYSIIFINHLDYLELLYITATEGIDVIHNNHNKIIEHFHGQFKFNRFIILNPQEMNVVFCNSFLKNLATDYNFLPTKHDRIIISNRHSHEPFHYYLNFNFFSLSYDSYVFLSD